MAVIKDLGAVTAYASAVEGGYTGTKAEFETLMASYATVAEEAAESAESASQSATQAGASAQTATTKAGEASTSATQASASATSASQSAQTATTKASEASASASTAGTKASEASQSATTASSKASEASASATSAQTAQGLAESARDDAVDAKTDAESARDLAQQYAESINPEKIYSAYPTDTASGAVVSFADGADGVPMKSVVVNIEPVQSGSGDPSPDNVRPISGWTGAQVARTGVNIWNEEWEVGAISSGNPVQANNAIRSKNFCPIKGGETYFLTSPKTDGGNQNRYYVFVVFYDENKNFISSTSSNNLTFTAPNNACYFKIATNTATVVYGGTYNHDISINYPATDTDYHPYTGTTYSITFPSEAGTVYGGTLDVTNGTLTVNRAMVDLGTLSWYVSSNPAGMVGSNMDALTFPSALYSNPNVVTDVMCEKFKISTYNSVTTGTDGIAAFGSGDARYIRIFYDGYIGKTAAEVKADLDGVKLIYTLLTPITYHLTPTEIKSLLGDNNVWADAGNTEVTYRADTKLYIEKKIAEVINALS